MPARILLIEDNEASLELLTYVLTAFGHTVFGACDGEQGLEAARRELPDLILSDLQMPKMDGYGVVRALRQDPRFQNRPIVAVTAFAMRDDRERVLASGFDGYISKPIAPEDFVAQVERFLGPDKHSAQRGAPSSEWQSPAPVRYHTTLLAVDNSPVNLSLLAHAIGMGVRKLIRRPIDPTCLVKEVEALAATRSEAAGASTTNPDPISAEPRGT